MKDSFNFNRISKLIKIHLTDNWKMYASSFGLLVIIIALVVSMQKNTNTFLYFIIPELYSISLIGAICFFTGSIFNSWTNESRSIFYINTPATNIEKYVSKLILIVLFIPLFTFLYYLTVYVVGNMFVKTTFSLYQMYDLSFSQQIISNSRYLTVLYSLFLLQPIFLLGALYFKKYQAVFTCIFLIAIFIVLYVVPGFFIYADSKYVITNIKLDEIIVYFKKGTNIPVQIGFKSAIAIINTIMFLFAGLLLYVAAYFKLKEKEI